MKPNLEKYQPASLPEIYRCRLPTRPAARKGTAMSFGTRRFRPAIAIPPENE
jgi:hypothetical protein